MWDFLFKVYFSSLKTCTVLKHKQGLWFDSPRVHTLHRGAKLMQGHCWFALGAGNAVWHTVDSTERKTHHRWREGKRYRLNKLSATDLSLLIYNIQTLLSFVYPVCFTNTLTKPLTSGYEVEVVKHTLVATLLKFTLHWERRGTFTSFVILARLTVWVMEKVCVAYSNMNLMKLTQVELRECVQRRHVWSLCLC